MTVHVFCCCVYVQLHWTSKSAEAAAQIQRTRKQHIGKLRFPGSYTLDFETLFAPELDGQTASNDAVTADANSGDYDETREHQSNDADSQNGADAMDLAHDSANHLLPSAESEVIDAAQAHPIDEAAAQMIGDDVTASGDILHAETIDMDIDDDAQLAEQAADATQSVADPIQPVGYAVIRSADSAAAFQWQRPLNRAARRAQAGISKPAQSTDAAQPTDAAQTSDATERNKTNGRHREKQYRLEQLQQFPAPELSLPTLVPVHLTMLKVSDNNTVITRYITSTLTYRSLYYIQSFVQMCNKAELARSYMSSRSVQRLRRATTET